MIKRAGWSRALPFRKWARSALIAVWLNWTRASLVDVSFFILTIKKLLDLDATKPLPTLGSAKACEKLQT